MSCRKMVLVKQTLCKHVRSDFSIKLLSSLADLHNGNIIMVLSLCLSISVSFYLSLGLCLNFTISLSVCLCFSRSVCFSVPVFIAFKLSQSCSLYLPWSLFIYLSCSLCLHHTLSIFLLDAISLSFSFSLCHFVSLNFPLSLFPICLSPCLCSWLHVCGCPCNPSV